MVVERGGGSECISVDRLKPAHLDLDQAVVVAQPPRRGRPPGGSPLSPGQVLSAPLLPVGHLPADSTQARPPCARWRDPIRFGWIIRFPGCFLGPVSVNSEGTCVVSSH